MSGKTLLITSILLGLSACDDRGATSDRNTPATDAPMTGGSVRSAPPSTAPATQPSKDRIDPQEIPADRAGLKDHASNRPK
jgi:hypothetical protein